MAKVFIKTWGCTLNQADSDIIKALLIEAGHQLTTEAEAELIVLNTCAVKGVTENKILDRLRSLTKENRNVLVTGCLTASPKKLLRAAPHATIVGTGALNHIADTAALALARKGGTFFSFSPKYTLPRLLGSPIARIPIGEGCLGKCTFCQSKLARPFIISYPPKEVIRLVEQAVAGGAREIQLTAMDTGAYGIDISTDLPSLLQAVLKIPGDFKVRLGMINPNHVRRFGNRLVAAYKHPKMFKFLHMPVQTGSEKVCREMGRSHSVWDFISAAFEYRRLFPDLMIATDIIAAYPTETEEDFQLTLRMLEKIRPDHVNISRFAPRPGTEAKKLKPLPSQVAKRRTSQLHALATRISLENAQQEIGKIISVLICEKGKPGQLKGRAPNYRQVVLKCDENLIGKTVMVKILEASATSLFGEIIHP